MLPSLATSGSQDARCQLGRLAQCLPLRLPMLAITNQLVAAYAVERPRRGGGEAYGEAIYGSCRCVGAKSCVLARLV